MIKNSLERMIQVLLSIININKSLIFIIIYSRAPQNDLYRSQKVNKISL